MQVSHFMWLATWQHEQVLDEFGRKDTPSNSVLDKGFSISYEMYFLHFNKFPRSGVSLACVDWKHLLKYACKREYNFIYIVHCISRVFKKMDFSFYIHNLPLGGIAYLKSH